MLADNPEGVALDCEMLMNIAPDGLASLAKLAKQIQAGGPKVHLTGLRGPALKMCIKQGLPNHPTPEAAVAALQ